MALLQSLFQHSSIELFLRVPQLLRLSRVRNLFLAVVFHNIYLSVCFLRATSVFDIILSRVFTCVTSTTQPFHRLIEVYVLFRAIAPFSYRIGGGNPSLLTQVCLRDTVVHGKRRACCDGV